MPPISTIRTLLLLLAAAAPLAKRPIRFEDFPADLRPYLGISDSIGFEKLRRNIERDTAERERLGEDEHLVYFILQ